MTAYLLPDDGSSRIITFDVIENELHETVAEVTDHPVETGINIADHVRPLPDRLSLTGYVSNTPIRPNPFTQRGEQISFELKVPQWDIPIEPTPGALYRAGLQAMSGLVGSLFGDDKRTVSILAFPDAFNAIVETYEVLRELQGNGVLLQIVTPVRTYEDMILERVSAPRNAGDAGVSFGLDVRQIRVVESGQVAAPPVPDGDVPGGVPLADKGGQGAKPPGAGEDEERPGSIAHRILNGQGLPTSNSSNSESPGGWLLNENL